MIVTTDLAAALRDALDASGMSQADLGAAVARIEGRPEPYVQNAVSAWLAGRVDMPPQRVFACERALGLRPGELSVHAGYVPVDAPMTSLELALAADRGLSAAQREVVVALVETLRARR